jgi:hypothetical protein
VLFCLAFVAISFSLRPESEEVHVLVKTDRLVRTAGEWHPANTVGKAGFSPAFLGL